MNGFEVRSEEQIDALYQELEKTIYRFRQEFDLKGSDLVWVLELLKQEAVDVRIDFQSDFWDIDEDKDDE